MIEALQAESAWSGWLVPVGADIAIKTTIVLLLAIACDRIFLRRWVLARSAMWNACLASLFLLPAATVAFPRLRIPVLPPRPSPVLAVHENARAIGPESMPNALAVAPTPAPFVGKGAEHRERAVPTRSQRPSVRTHTWNGVATVTQAPNGSEQKQATASRAVSAIAAPVMTSSPPGSESPLSVRHTPARQVRRGTWVDWPTLVGIIYAVGVAWLVVRLICSLVAVAILKRSGEALTDRDWIDALAHWRSRLGIRWSVALAQTSRVTVPTAIGWTSPTILLPTSLAGPISKVSRDAILVHELAHILRQDYVWQILFRIVQAIYWPHPLMWIVDRLMGGTRERACDELCVHHLSDSGSYRSVLIEVAAGLVRGSRRPGWVGAPMARTPSLTRRLRHIDCSRGLAHCRARPALRIGMVGIAFAAVGLIAPMEFSRRAAKAEQSKSSPTVPSDSQPIASRPRLPSAPLPTTTSQTSTARPWTPGRPIDFRVVHAETGEPVPGVFLKISVDRSTRVGLTDAQGRWVINLPRKEPWEVIVHAQKPGFVTTDVYFRGFSMKFDLPEQYVLRLKPGTTIGGMVKDESNKPIHGATVYVSMPIDKSMERLHILDVPCPTDAEGRWRCDVVPANIEGIRVHVRHPQYIGDLNLYARPAPPTNKLRDMTYVMVMKKGLVLRGQVLNKDGKPVKGAYVLMGEYILADELPRQSTDSDGRFQFSNAKPGRTVLTVYAEGHAPDQKEVVASADPSPVEFRLGPPNIIHGRVVDPEGKPLKGVSVSPSRWRGLDFHIVSLKTDADGRFSWNNAPADAVGFYVGKDGYQTRFDYSLAPSKEGHVITLARTAIVRGTVLDAQTRQPISRFQVKRSTTRPYSPGGWETQGKIFGGGKYSVDFWYPASEYRVRIEAEGYKPAVSPKLKSSEQEQTCDFALERVAAGTSSRPMAEGEASPAATSGETTPAEAPVATQPAGPKPKIATPALTGRVLDLHARPVYEAQVHVLEPGVETATAGVPTDTEEYAKTQTDIEGHFSVGCPKSGRIIVIVQASGYAPELKELAVPPPADALEFRLGPGHTLRGRIVNKKGEVVPGCGVIAGAWRGYRFILEHPRVDEQGRFVWKDAPADEVEFNFISVSYCKMEKRLTPADAEHLITLHRPLTITGTVRDAETGEPIPAFKILPDTAEGGLSALFWQSERTVRVSAGQFSITSGRYVSHEGPTRFRIEAQDYGAFTSREFNVDEENVTYDVKLTKAPRLTGTVKDPDGRLLNKAVVVLADPCSPVWVENRQLSSFLANSEHRYVRTGDDGRYSFASPDKPCGLVVLHEQGWALASTRQAATGEGLSLRPWGRVEGTVRIGSKPGIGMQVELMLLSAAVPDTPQILHECTATTDTKGRFVLERVFPGLGSITLETKDSESNDRTTYEGFVDVVSGQTAQMAIGGTGRPVVGRIALPAGCTVGQDIKWESEFNRLSLLRPRPPMPDEVRRKGWKAQDEWWWAWLTSAEGKVWRKASLGRIVRVNPDGTFRAEDVPGGAYVLNLHVWRKPEGMAKKMTEAARIRHTVAGPDIPRGRSDEPLDLGTLSPTPIGQLKPGDVAPPLDLVTSEGKQLSLTDLRGRWVAVFFYVFSLDSKEGQELDRVAQHFAGNKRFVMLGVNVTRAYLGDETMHARFVMVEAFMPRMFQDLDSSEPVRWIRCGADLDVAERLQVDYGLGCDFSAWSDLPPIFLIGPDGKILASRLKVDQVRPAVEEALAGRPD